MLNVFLLPQGSSSSEGPNKQIKREQQPPVEVSLLPRLTGSVSWTTVENVQTWFLGLSTALYLSQQDYGGVTACCHCVPLPEGLQNERNKHLFEAYLSLYSRVML